MQEVTHPFFITITKPFYNPYNKREAKSLLKFNEMILGETPTLLGESLTKSV